MTDAEFAAALNTLRQNIGHLESRNNYAALGPVTRTGDRAIGKYQVMPQNVGPWTKQYLGVQLTPEQFRASPQAQEDVFTARMGDYLQHTQNPQDAASMWFTGRTLAQGGATARDVNGMSGAQYAALAVPHTLVQQAQTQTPGPDPATRVGATVGAPTVVPTGSPINLAQQEQTPQTPGPVPGPVPGRPPMSMWAMMLGPTLGALGSGGSGGAGDISDVPDQPAIRTPAMTMNITAGAPGAGSPDQPLGQQLAALSENAPWAQGFSLPGALPPAANADQTQPVQTAAVQTPAGRTLGQTVSGIATAPARRYTRLS